MGSQWTSLGDALIERAQTHTNQLAYRWADRKMTFGELAERADTLAQGLQESGITKGDRVALAMRPGLATVEMFWATQLIGAAPCIFNPFVPAPTLEARIRRIEPRMVITDEGDTKVSIERGAMPRPPVDAEDLAYLQLTSGTSGDPRAALIRQRNVLTYLRGRNRVGDLGPDDVLVNWMPMWHDFGLVAFVVGAVYFGLGCHMLDPSIAALPDWLTTIDAVRGTHTGGPDFAYRLACRMVDPNSVDLSSLRVAWTGAEPVRWSTITQFETQFSVPGVVMPAYGLAEATLGVTTHLPGDDRAVDAHGNVSCGRPIGNLEVRAGADVEHPDEILVRGDWVFAGYFKAEDETNEKLHHGWLHTGDSGYLDAQGRLFVLGRRSTLIKRAGSVVAPREIEEAAQQVAGVRLAAATSLTRPDHDDVIVVIIETREPDQAALLGPEVSKAVHAALGFAPHRVVIVAPQTIPRSGSGKIRYGMLQEALQDGTIG
jgi:acyl-CoA synthetase (AMP-forming)/AMP-acid ligase II